MVTKTPSPRRQRKKAAVNARIIARGIELFSSRGIDAVTVEEIAAAADVGKGTIYNYFSTKEEIVVAFMAELERAVQAKLAAFEPAAGPLDRVLAEYIRAPLTLKKRHHRFVRLFFAQMFSNTERFLPYMVEMQRAIDPPLAALFGTLKTRGAIREDVGLGDLILAFKTIHLGLTALWAVEGPPFTATERTLQTAVKLLCEGMKGKRS